MATERENTLDYLVDQTVPQKQAFAELQDTVTQNAAETSPIHPTPTRRDRSSSDSPDNKNSNDKQSA
ncbi:hypothetical protein BGX24_006299, partial [Mortierella sp. AD032]